MDSLLFCQKIIEKLSAEHNLKIEVSTDNDEIILPFAAWSNGVIYLSSKCYALIMLDVLGESQKFIELLLSIHMVQNDKYDFLSELLDNYPIELKINNKSETQNRVLVQMFVISMHEFAHCLFHLKQEVKEIYYKLADEILSDFVFEDEEDDALQIYESFSSIVEDSSTSDKIIDYIKKHTDLSNENLNRSMEESIENTNRRLSKKEEYAADIFAVDVFYTIFSQCGVINGDNIQRVLEYAFDTFFFLSNYNNIEDKIDLGHNKRDITFRPTVGFDSIRWMVVYATLSSVSEGRFNIVDPIKSKIIPFNKKLMEYIIKLADKKYDKYLEITSRGSGIRRDEALYKDACNRLSTLIHKMTSQLQ